MLPMSIAIISLMRVLFVSLSFCPLLFVSVFQTCLVCQKYRVVLLCLYKYEFANSGLLHVSCFEVCMMADS